MLLSHVSLQKKTAIPFHHWNHRIIWLVSHNVINEVQFSTWSAWKGKHRNELSISCHSDFFCRLINVIITYELSQFGQ